MRRKISYFCLVIAFILFCLVVKAEDTVEIQVLGEALIIDHNLPAAKELAISDGLNKAVEQVVGTLVYSETNVENYQLIKDSIRLKSAGYVTGYEVLNTWTELGVLKALLVVTVKKGSIIEDLDELQLILKRAGNPRIMVFFSESKFQKNNIPVRTLEKEIINGLVQAGYQVVEGPITSNREEFARLKNNGKQKSFQSLMPEYGADILIFGEAASEVIGRYQGLVSCRAWVEMRTIKASTGEILLVQEVSESGVDLTEYAAAEKAIKKAGENIVTYFMEEIPKKLIIPNNIEVIINNISYSELVLIERKLKEMSLVTQVNLREFASNKARFTVETTLLASQLAEQLSGWKDLSLDINEVLHSRIELSLFKQDW